MTRLARRRPAVVRAVVAGVTSLALLSLAGCGDAEKGDALTDVKLIVKDTLTVCTDIPYAPFEYKENGQPTGFDIELVEHVAKTLDVELDVIDVAFDDVVSGLALNIDRCDVAISALGITGERARVIDFSSPYFDSKQALITPRGSGIDQLSELAGKQVGVQEDTTGLTFLKDFAPVTAKIVPFIGVADLEQSMVNGEVDAILLDNTASGQVVAANRSLKVAREFDQGEQYGMAVKKDGNIPLLRKINSALAEFRKSGGYDKLFKKYFG